MTDPGSRKLLQDLVLLRSDPALAGRARAAAMRGDVNAQYALGLIYAEGRGVDEDAVEAYAWLSLAVLQGDRDAESLRFVVAELMSEAQCDAGMRRAAEYEARICAGDVLLN